MKWISVTDELPDLGFYVLITGGGETTTGFRLNYRTLPGWGWVSELKLDISEEIYYFEYDIVTHWMPLPELPSTDS